MTKAAIALVACRRIGDTSFLFADMNIQCYTPEYTVWLGLAVPMIFVFSLGVPVSYFFVLRRHYKRGRLEHHRNIYGYLTSGYNDAHYWFELWNTLRKALFTSCALIFCPIWGSYA